MHSQRKSGLQQTVRQPAHGRGQRCLNALAAQKRLAAQGRGPHGRRRRDVSMRSQRKSGLQPIPRSKNSAPPAAVSMRSQRKSGLQQGDTP